MCAIIDKSDIPLSHAILAGVLHLCEALADERIGSSEYTGDEGDISRASRDLRDYVFMYLDTHRDECDEGCHGYNQHI